MKKNKKLLIEKIVDFFLKSSAVNKAFRKRVDIITDVVSQMAFTGDNTEKCLEKGFLPVAIHFYQPIPDIKDLEKRNIWDNVSKLSGIKFKPIEYLEFIKLLGRKYGKECKWPNNPTPNSEDFYLNNDCFSYGCASALHSIIREFKPRKIIEIGSGNSSKIIRNALDLNLKENNCNYNYVIVDPYSSLKKEDFSQNTEIINRRVEEIDPEFFKQLNENDILFIDSSHVCKIGSDVNFEILEVLPMLNKGVMIHFHDVHLPYEYSKVYAMNPKFRMFWTEAYLLQSFLICNNDFEIILPMAYVQSNFKKEFGRFFPNSVNAENLESGSFWIKRIK
jgi:hypothetical protein